MRSLGRHKVGVGFLLWLCLIVGTTEGKRSLWSGDLSSISIDQCDDCRCSEDTCDLVDDEICHEDDMCSRELRKCVDRCFIAKEGLKKSPPPLIEGSAENMTPENEILLDQIVVEEISKLDRGQRRKIKKSAARRLDFDRREVEKFNIIVDCVKVKGVDMEFVPKNKSDTKCMGLFEKDSLNMFFTMCSAEWISGYNRVTFFEKCLKETNIEAFHRKIRQQSKLLEQVAFNVERYSVDFSDARIAGGSQLIAGGLLCGLGIIIPPLAPIASFLGIGLTITGSTTTMASTLLGSSWTDGEARRAKDEMSKMEEEYNNLANVIGLYLKSHHYLTLTAEKGSITALNSLEHGITQSLIQASPAIARLPDIAKVIFRKISKSALVKGLGATKFPIKPKIFSFISDDILKGAASKFSTSPFGMALNKMITSNTLKTAGRLVVPGITLAIGVWDVICGSDNSRVHKGLLHEVRHARRTLEYNADSVKEAYINMFPDYKNFTSGQVASISLLEFHIIEGTWHYQNGIKLRMLNNKEEVCVTDIITGISSGTWFTVFETRFLKECGEFFIYNDVVSIQLISDHNSLSSDRVVVDIVNIGTNGHFLPSLTCQGKDLTVNNANQSEWMNCTRKVGMQRIKVHTSNTDYAGTDNYIKFGIDIQTQATEGSKFGEVVSCATGDLNNVGNDFEIGQTDIYRPAEGSFGDCTDSELANALLERDPKEPIQLTIISKPYLGWDDQWNPDSVKVYFNVKESKMMVITCAFCDHKDGKCNEGWGHWIHGGNHTFECYPLNPRYPERSIEKIRVKACDLRDAGSSTHKLRMKICREPGLMNIHNNTLTHYDVLNGTAPCCTTNLFGNEFTRDQWTKTIDGDGKDRNGVLHDGGEQLGQCEGFPIDGTQLYLGLKNEDSDALCLDHFEFYGGYGVGSSSRDIPTIRCDSSTTCHLWSESESNYCEDDSEWSNWYDKEVKCEYLHSTSTVKTIAMKVCDGESSGSKATFQAVIKNMDDEECNTEEIKGDLTPGSYFEFSDMGDCISHAIKENKATVWILNMDAADDLCLSDVYLDVSDAGSGKTRMLKCRVDQDTSMQLNVSGKDRIGLPLTCM